MIFIKLITCLYLIIIRPSYWFLALLMTLLSNMLIKYICISYQKIINNWIIGKIIQINRRLDFYIYMGFISCIQKMVVFLLIKKRTTNKEAKHKNILHIIKNNNGIIDKDDIISDDE